MRSLAGAIVFLVVDAGCLGAVGLGAPCRHTSECSGGLVCASLSSTQGVCAPKRAQAGEGEGEGGAGEGEGEGALACGALVDLPVGTGRPRADFDAARNEIVVVSTDNGSNGNPGETQLMRYGLDGSVHAGPISLGLLVQFPDRLLVNPDADELALTLSNTGDVDASLSFLRLSPTGDVVAAPELLVSERVFDTALAWEASPSGAEQNEAGRYVVAWSVGEGIFGVTSRSPATTDPVIDFADNADPNFPQGVVAFAAPARHSIVVAPGGEIDATGARSPIPQFFDPISHTTFGRQNDFVTLSHVGQLTWAEVPSDAASGNSIDLGLYASDISEARMFLNGDGSVDVAAFGTSEAVDLAHVGADGASTGFLRVNWGDQPFDEVTSIEIAAVGTPLGVFVIHPAPALPGEAPGQSLVLLRGCP